MDSFSALLTTTVRFADVRGMLSVCVARTEQHANMVRVSYVVREGFALGTEPAVVLELMGDKIAHAQAANVIEKQDPKLLSEFAENLSSWYANLLSPVAFSAMRRMAADGCTVV